MRKYCVIGTPVGHSKSPQLFEKFIGERGLEFGKDAVYERHEITDTDELDAFVKEMRAGEWDGCNVTMPWKTDMVKYMDDISETARVTDSVNTVSARRGKLYGDSTDGRGMLNAIADVRKKERMTSMVILGCGGAARSIIAEAIIRKTGKIVIACRGVSESSISPVGSDSFKKSDNKGDEHECKKSMSNMDLTLAMLSRMKTGNTEIVFVDIEDADALQASLDEAEILINSTPLGMLDGKGNENRLPLPEEIHLRKSLLVADCVYNPDETLLLKKAIQAGCKTVKGIRMLEEQARCGVDILLGKYQER